MKLRELLNESYGDVTTHRLVKYQADPKKKTTEVVIVNGGDAKRIPTNKWNTMITVPKSLAPNVVKKLSISVEDGDIKATIGGFKCVKIGGKVQLSTTDIKKPFVIPFSDFEDIDSDKALFVEK